ncbi:amino acid polyamine transporter I protein [Rutstroemia sp. NJR-2017a BBW]|nr:amino acid polyamine transporter I protein [Rutstroemia sp. NJR-2017a BBW]
MTADHELTTLNGWKTQHTTNVAAAGSGSNLKDESELARAGKKQVFKRNFGLISMIGFSCGLMATWEGELAGGPAGLIYGLLFVWLGTLSVFTVLGELSSMITTAGGQYHWVSVLAPPSAKNFLSYITGWLTVVGWIAAVTASATFGSGMILTLAAMNNPEYVPLGWHSTFVSWAIFLICFAMNTILSGILPVLETLVLILHILAFCAIAIPLIYLSPHGSVKPIFTTFANEGGWSTQALSVFVGMNGNALAFERMVQYMYNLFFLLVLALTDQIA